MCEHSLYNTAAAGVGGGSCGRTQVFLLSLLRRPALVLVGYFNFPDICWEYNLVQKKQSWRFLECMEDNFLMQLVRKPMRGAAPLDLLFTNRGLVGDVEVGGSLGQSDHNMVEFSILGRVRRGNSRTATLDFRGQTLNCSGD